MLQLAIMNHAQEPIRCSRCGQEIQDDDNEDVVEIVLRPLTKKRQPHASRSKHHGWLDKKCAALLLGGPEIVISALKHEAKIRSRQRPRATTGTHRIVSAANDSSAAEVSA